MDNTVANTDATPKPKRRNGETKPVEMSLYDCTLRVRISPSFAKVVEFQRQTKQKTEDADEASTLRILALYVKDWTLMDEDGNKIPFSVKALEDCDSEFISDAYASIDAAGFFPSVSESAETSSSNSEETPAQSLQPNTP